MIEWFGFQVEENNVPREKAGAYLFLNLLDGQAYVGVGVNVAKRCRGRENDKMLLGRAIRKHGISNFLLIPLYYSLENTGEELTTIEVDLIIDWETLHPNGYNIIASSKSGGKRGEAYLKLQRAGIAAAWNDPEKKLKRLAKYIGEEYSDKLSKAQKESYKDPEKRISRLKYLQDLEYRQRFTEIQGSTETRKKRSESLLKVWEENPRVWITNGTEETHHFASEPISDGWWRGRLPKDEETKIKISAGVRATNVGNDALKLQQSNSQLERWLKSPLIWITNGTANKRVSAEDELPEGWRLGRTFKYKGKVRGSK